MVREARFAWDTDDQCPDDLRRSPWDCDDPELDISDEQTTQQRRPHKKSKRGKNRRNEDEPNA